MAFAGTSSCTNVQLGPAITEIQSEDVGFLGLSGESKVRLLPTPWPSENLPPPTASLMSIASKTGLLAAAGPDVIILAMTEPLRKAFDGMDSDGHLKRFEPQLKIPMNFRISHLTFSSDEKYLILTAETGGGLAIYEVKSLMSGSHQSAFELPTNGQALRALAPNPSIDKGDLLAVITVDGNLMMANLNDRNFMTGAQGIALKDCVSCISWSSRGKQLVAGLGDGTAYQMTPDGQVKSIIPRPPGLNPGDHSKQQNSGAIYLADSRSFFDIMA
ncbi:Nucleoporin NUP159 [Golovinomyces cichoracearum]|uniref:Nucleoporin NUP159 n=1 Tax=Golovinomyces cichoracearum TaxID=62708 RepID=A0A420ILN0_9PEZI|nr:Nucleoporin NUP159 [Golovinomyces cichoracearum]